MESGENQLKLKVGLKKDIEKYKENTQQDILQRFEKYL